MWEKGDDDMRNSSGSSSIRWACSTIGHPAYYFSSQLSKRCDFFTNTSLNEIEKNRSQRNKYMTPKGLKAFNFAQQ